MAESENPHQSPQLTTHKTQRQCEGTVSIRCYTAQTDSHDADTKTGPSPAPDSEIPEQTFKASRERDTDADATSDDTSQLECVEAVAASIGCCSNMIDNRDYSPGMMFEISHGQDKSDLNNTAKTDCKTNDHPESTPSIERYGNVKSMASITHNDMTQNGGETTLSPIDYSHYSLCESESAIELLTKAGEVSSGISSKQQVVQSIDEMVGNGFADRNSSMVKDNSCYMNLTKTYDGDSISNPILKPLSPIKKDNIPAATEAENSQGISESNRVHYNKSNKHDKGISCHLQDYEKVTMVIRSTTRTQNLVKHTSVSHSTIEKRIATVKGDSHHDPNIHIYEALEDPVTNADTMPGNHRDIEVQAYLPLTTRQPPCGVQIDALALPAENMDCQPTGVVQDLLLQSAPCCIGDPHVLNITNSCDTEELSCNTDRERKISMEQFAQPRVIPSGLSKDVSSFPKTSSTYLSRYRLKPVVRMPRRRYDMSESDTSSILSSSPFLHSKKQPPKHSSFYQKYGGAQRNKNYNSGGKLCPKAEASKFIGEYLCELWKNECLCDVRIQTNNKCFLAHKIVLAAFSDVFCPSEPMPTPALEVKVPNCSSNAVYQILHYLYTSEIEIMDETIEDLLSAALFLGVTDIVELIKDILFHPTKDNVVHYLEISKRLNMVIDYSERPHVFRNFLQEIWDSDVYKGLDEDTIHSILSDQQVLVDSETDLLVALSKWIEGDMDNRMDLLPSLLRHINFVCIPPQILSQTVESYPHIFNTVCSQAILAEVYKLFAIIDVEDKTDDGDCPYLSDAAKIQTNGCRQRRIECTQNKVSQCLQQQCHNLGSLCETERNGSLMNSSSSCPILTDPETVRTKQVISDQFRKASQYLMSSQQSRSNNKRLLCKNENNTALDECSLEDDNIKASPNQNCCNWSKSKMFDVPARKSANCTKQKLIDTGTNTDDFTNTMNYMYRKSNAGGEMEQGDRQTQSSYCANQMTGSRCCQRQSRPRLCKQNSPRILSRSSSAPGPRRMFNYNTPPTSSTYNTHNDSLEMKDAKDPYPYSWSSTTFSNDDTKPYNTRAQTHHHRSATSSSYRQKESQGEAYTRSPSLNSTSTFTPKSGSTLTSSSIWPDNSNSTPDSYCRTSCSDFHNHCYMPYNNHQNR